MTDSTMRQVVRGNKLNRKQDYTKEFFKNYFAKRKIEELMEFLLPNVDNLETLIKKAKLFGLNISPKQKHVSFQFAGVEVKETELNKKNLYDVEFFKDYFEKRIKLKSPKLKDLVQVYQEFRRNRDAVHEFEVELSFNQIEKVVDDGIYIKVKFGIRQEGLVFVPNMELDTVEDKVKVFIRETSSYYVYHKDDPEKNRYMKGKTLICQFSSENQTIPFRRKTTVKMIKEKIEEVYTLLELDTEKQSYITIEDELIYELAASELRINALQERVTILNQVAEYLLSSVENKQEMKLNLSKLNITEAISINVVEENLKELGNQLALESDRYENIVFKVSKFINRVSKKISKEEGIGLQR